MTILSKKQTKENSEKLGLLLKKIRLNSDANNDIRDGSPQTMRELVKNIPGKAVPHSVVGKVENNTRELKVSELPAYCAALGVTVDYVMTVYLNELKT